VETRFLKTLKPNFQQQSQCVLFFTFHLQFKDNTGVPYSYVFGNDEQILKVEATVVSVECG